ncbi:MAG: LacI family DNA-binding transcriptional regulator [Spirochaetales bacterium]|nr:LacI family DNA-binding transcriptional regulator [Spirochaetales bacterium]
MTLKDLAKTCGLDISTISRALRGDPRVRAETIEKVKAAAQKSGYKPNLAARTLAAGTSRTIWLVLPGLTNAIESHPAEYASRYLGNKGWDLLASVYNGDRMIFERLLDRLEQGVCDGAIIIGTGDWGESRLQKLKNQGYPIIMLDRPSFSVDVPAVTTDNYGAVGLLLNGMEKSGCRSFICLYHDGDYVAAERERAAIDWFKDKGYPYIQENDTIQQLLKTTAASDVIGVIGTSQGSIIDYYSKHKDILSDRETCFALFDKWAGNAYPAQKIFVCEQDFKLMAETAASQLLQIIDGEDVHGVSSIPLLKINTIKRL